MEPTILGTHLRGRPPLPALLRPEIVLHPRHLGAAHAAEVVDFGAADVGEGAVAAVVLVLGRDEVAVPRDSEELIEDLPFEAERLPTVADPVVLAAASRKMVLHRLDLLAQD